MPTTNLRVSEEELEAIIRDNGALYNRASKNDPLAVNVMQRLALDLRQARLASTHLDWLAGLLHDEGNLVLSRIPYPDGPVVTIATRENGDGEEVDLASSERAVSVTAGLLEAISIAVNQVPT